MKKISNSPEDTLQLGKSLGISLGAGDIILLFGDLGAGKTCFTQGICYGLELDKASYIRSPTFTLINEYQGRLPIYHIDLYRIETQEEIFSLGLEEILYNQGVTIIEWAEKLRLPRKSDELILNIQDRLEINIKIINDSQREFTFNPVFSEPRSFPDFTLH
ncbi:MAG: tRNA (adenosine(37)-N6)-threonylcarbamoyltransferase complex ATPase subunit type 1 TsaE [Nitrospina sp.]|jgi:tRNA threonylcarbamoyladenosine biosynthesis protein TsaE|nr:tRNA (adenosine(37)-N6)-threonylcarbamoyltransferase complex ATPase subunit type 1 TsaE [Nitrospina sp.]